MESKKKFSTQKLVLTALMTALVVVFQVAAIIPTFGTFSSALALVPIIIGAALLGPYIGGWLGFVFAVVALLTPSTWFFLAEDPFATIVVVLAKGIACGFVSGLVYKLLLRVNDIFASVIASLVCPLVNTGVFMLGGIVFFTDNLERFTNDIYSGVSDAIIWFWGLASANFVFEFAFCVLLTPIIIKVIDIAKQKTSKTRKRKHHHHHHHGEHHHHENSDANQ